MSAFEGKANIIKRRKCNVIERELFLIHSAKPVPDIGFLLCDHRPHAEADLLESLIPLRALPTLPRRTTLALRIYGSKT